MQVPAPFEYERATSVDHAIGLLERLGERGPARRRRAQPAADDEAAAGQPRVPHRHQRPARRARLRPGRRRRGPDRRDDPAPRAAGVPRARRAVPDLRRRRAGDRRPGRAQPRHDRRLAVPGRPVGGPDRGVHHPRRQLRHPRRRRRAGGLDGATSTAAPTRPRSGTARSSPRSGSRSGRTGRSAYAKVERRAGDWAVDLGGRRGLDGRRHDHRRPGRAGRGRPEHHRHPGDLGGAARAAARRRTSTPQAGAIAAESCSPATDNRGTADYKRHLADELTRRTLRLSVERIQAGVAGDRDQGRNG